jgi:hypothetical protein
MAEDRVRRPLVVAWEKRARERAGEQSVDRQLILWGVPALVVVGLVAIAAGVGILLVFALVFGVYFWALRKLAAALRGDYAPVATCALLAAVMMTMQAVALLLLGRDGGTGALLAALSGGIFVFGVLARYRLCLSMKNALILTVGTAVETVVITVIFAAALQSLSDGYRRL